MKQFLQVQFDESEREMIREKQFSINLHEQLSAVFALFYNKSAVSWCNSLSSREPLAQEQNRVLGALEARLGLRVSAEHLPGESNYLADLCSQGRSGKHATTWQQLTNLWSQVPVSPAARKIYSSTLSSYSRAPCPNHHYASTQSRENSGPLNMADLGSNGARRGTPCWLTAGPVMNAEEGQQ
ncbi:hypothetical protein PPTG_09382 [Phytophthora nicotianae INRA-310]|uniref:Uncharacterized protein n=1 Tax=Phytophthora nicotianae (strain INRA-310) TaxID=761204 RepID=W2QES1_PHYN3|nr:hypothetical protein PPTG_09382 [Phytophthora nicotianae INRA-310]ETN11667.1 hypothetical protein PPTG_09382 [Phytophthora nicotianae INRA-310]